MKEFPLYNPENISDEEVRSYTVREAVRAVVVDKENQIALLHVTTENYFKLPGGGLDAGESHELGLRRECKEEIGCDVEIVGEIASFPGLWKRDKERDISYCYLAKVKGEKGFPELTEEEKEEGFITVWFSYDGAVKALKTSNKSTYESRYITSRDLMLLDEAKKNFPLLFKENR